MCVCRFEHETYVSVYSIPHASEGTPPPPLLPRIGLPLSSSSSSSSTFSQPSSFHTVTPPPPSFLSFFPSFYFFLSELLPRICFPFTLHHILCHHHSIPL